PSSSQGSPSWRHLPDGVLRAQPAPLPPAPPHDDLIRRDVAENEENEHEQCDDAEAECGLSDDLKRVQHIRQHASPPEGPLTIERHDHPQLVPIARREGYEPG